MAHHVATVRTYITIWAALLVLVLVTVIAARSNLGPFNLALAMSIAIVKALLVILYFMHVRWSSPLTWVFAGAAFVWLGILLVLSNSDYATRGSEPGARVVAPAMVPAHQGAPSQTKGTR
jgi:cytochrome c oxidase subunit IV